MGTESIAAMTDVNAQNAMARELLPIATNRSDRLPPMLFVAALFYAVLILGVTFDIGLDAAPPNTTSLEVTIVAESARREARPDDADYLAQANQAGNGNTREQVTPGAAPVAPGQISIDHDRVGPLQQEQLAGTQEYQDLVATTVTTERRVLQPDDAVDDAAEEKRLAQALPAGMEQSLPLPEEDNTTLLITDDDPRHLVVSVNSAQSDIAPYLNDWKRRVERIGTLNFPRELAASGVAGSPTLAVAIAPDGQLSEARILQSSGHSALDQAAMLILNRAAPFAGFPEHLRERYDLLRFAYKFEFRGGSVNSSVNTDGG